MAVILFALELDLRLLMYEIFKLPEQDGLPLYYEWILEEEREEPKRLFLREVLQNEWHRLTDRQSNVLKLRFTRKMNGQQSSFTEIAKELNITGLNPRENVSQTIANGLNRLRKSKEIQKFRVRTPEENYTEEQKLLGVQQRLNFLLANTIEREGLPDAFLALLQLILEKPMSSNAHVEISTEIVTDYWALHCALTQFSKTHSTKLVTRVKNALKDHNVHTLSQLQSVVESRQINSWSAGSITKQACRLILSTGKQLHIKQAPPE